MAKKYKLTGCAKFFVFFLFAAPIAYVGASYYNGQDPVHQVKEFIASFTGGDDDYIDKNVNAGPDIKKSDEGSVYDEIELKNLEIKNLKNDLDDCEKLNSKKDDHIDKQKKEIKFLKQQGTE